MHHYSSNDPHQQQRDGRHYDDEMYYRSNNEVHTSDWYRQITLEDAIQIARRQVPGQAVKAELERKGGMLVYEVDIVTAQGVKYEVTVDANTGRIIRIEVD